MRGARTAFTAYTAPTYSAAPTMADMQALANQVQSTSRHLAVMDWLEGAATAPESGTPGQELEDA